MLAHAFLAAVTAAEHAIQPDELNLVPLTLAEVQRLMTRLQTTHPPHPDTVCTGHAGDDASKPTPAAATTSNNPAGNNENHDLQTGVLGGPARWAAGNHWRSVGLAAGWEQS